MFYIKKTKMVQHAVSSTENQSVLINALAFHSEISKNSVRTKENGRKL